MKRDIVHQQIFALLGLRREGRRTTGRCGRVRYTHAGHASPLMMGPEIRALSVVSGRLGALALSVRMGNHDRM